MWLPKRFGLNGLMAIRVDESCCFKECVGISGATSWAYEPERELFRAGELHKSKPRGKGKSEASAIIMIADPAGHCLSCLSTEPHLKGRINVAQIALGRTGLRVEQNGFGALPIQRVPMQEAVHLLRKAHDGGITFYDTARGYSDSEEKLGEAFGGMWDRVIIATKTHAKDVRIFWDDLDTSLRTLNTDHIDIYQFHNPAFIPMPEDESGLYEAILQAKQQGKIRFIGITNHRLDVAREAVASGLYDTLQFPFSYLSTEGEIDLVQACKEKGMGFIAMKALSGGLITHSAAACAWLTRFEHLVPIWGIQRERELDEFLSYIPTPPALDDALSVCIEADRKELQGNFCRGCGYCLPCPQGIAINTCARASLLIRRAPSARLLSESGRQMMEKIKSCTECGQCSAKCPYDLDTPALLKKNYQDYLKIIAGEAM